MPDLPPRNAKLEYFENLELRDENGERPVRCPSCRGMHALFVGMGLSGSYPIPLVSPRYIGEGVWLCGSCGKQFCWPFTKDELVPVFAGLLEGMYEVEQKVLKIKTGYSFDTALIDDATNDIKIELE